MDDFFFNFVPWFSKKLGTAAARRGVDSIPALVNAELAEETYAKLIRKETGAGCDSGTVAVLWMKRTVQFVCGIIAGLLHDRTISLADASRASYAKTLRNCHNFVTRGVFDTGLRFAPTRDVFYKNLAGEGNAAKVNDGLRDFIDASSPALDVLIRLFKNNGLETYIV